MLFFFSFCLSVKRTCETLLRHLTGGIYGLKDAESPEF